jgi:hypothetical protein
MRLSPATLTDRARSPSDSTLSSRDSMESSLDTLIMCFNTGKDIRAVSLSSINSCVLECTSKGKANECITLNTSKSSENRRVKECLSSHNGMDR